MVLKHRVKTGKKKAVWFTDQDLEILELIWDFKYLSLYQLKYYCESLYGIKPSSLEMKLRRWRDGEVLIAKKYTKPPAAKVFYRLGPEGISILKKTSKLSESSKILLEDLPGRRNYDHFFALRDAVLLSLIEIRKSNRGVTSFSPAEIPYLLESKSSVPKVVPDWILVNNHGFLNFELDIGTESFSKVNQKIQKYVEYTRQRPKEKHHVLLVVLDDNDPRLLYENEYSKDRSGRVTNLKELIIQSNAHKYSNLNFYVVSINRVGDLASKILSGDYPLKPQQRLASITAATKLLDLNDKFMYRINPIAESDIYFSDVSNSLYADGHFEFSYGAHSGKILIKIMEEGNVQCLDQIQYLNLLCAEKRYKSNIDKIIAVYQNNEELHSDVLGAMLPYVYFTSKEQLSLDLEEHPKFYKTVNTAKKEEVLLYEGNAF